MVSRRPNHFIFIGYLKTGDMEGVRVTLEGELANLHGHVNTCQYDHYNTCQKRSFKILSQTTLVVG